MLKNYLTIAWRTILHNKAFSAINIFGLALGMACSLLIFLWVQDERGIDHFPAQSSQDTRNDRIYTIYERQYIDGKIDAGYYTPGLLANEMKRVIPEVQYASGSSMEDKATFQIGDKIIKEEGGSADSDYFKIFSYPLLQGNPLTALNSPLSLAISNKMARQFFGSAASAIGRTIRYENKKDLSITAVFADLGPEVSQKFDFLVNWPTFQETEEWTKNWENNGPHTHLMLKAGANPTAVRAKIRKFLEAYNKGFTASFRIELDMQPFGDGYLHSNFRNGRIEGGRIEYVRLFSLVAVFILLIACINFMNLTTAHSVRRSREIGIRKVAGALRFALIRQFLGEALFITCLSVIIALLGVFLLLPLFNQLTGKQIRLPFGDSRFWLGLLLLTLVTGLIAGSYPALLLSSLKPIRVLKGTLKFGPSAGLLRKGLVIFQFALSIILIIGTLVISRQVSYVQQINLGYDRANLLYIPLEGDLAKNFGLFSQQALNTPGIQRISYISAESPADIENGTGGVDWDGKAPNTSPQFTQVAIGYDFTKTMGLKLVQGRDFSRDFATDSTGYLVNEAALKIINYKDPIGKPLTQWGKKGAIIGVLKDFHFMSLHDPIKPLILRMEPAGSYGSALIRTEPGKTPQALAGLEKIVKTLNPRFTFTYAFSEEDYLRLYKSEQIVSKLSNAFAALAIFISCMGLLGLAMFTAEQRAKEMSIRKVLGASASSLFTLLSREFMILVLIALLVAIPIAWIAMNDWLTNFADRIPIGWWIFGLAGGAALFIALATVSFQAAKTALANPIQRLRNE